MDAIIYIPYVDTDLNNHNFDYDDTSFDFTANLNNLSNNIIGGEYYVNNISKYKNTARLNPNQNTNYSDQISFYELPCNLYDSNECDIDMDYLLNLYKTKESFMLIFSFNPEFENEECLLELKSWVCESKKIMSMPDNIYDNELKISLLPKRNFKLKINKANAYLEECLFFDDYQNKIVIFVKEITFYN